jgi:hypothetical protein
VSSRRTVLERPAHTSRPRSQDMEYDDYLREQAAKYRQLAEEADDPAIKQELLDLAATCEEIANRIEDSLTAG